MYLAATLLSLWFPIYPVDLCSLETVICPEESPAYIENYIRDEFNKAGLDGDRAARIAYLESRYRLDAIGYNKDSRDRGVLQLNDKWHPEVSDECAFDLACSVREAIRIVKESGFNQWTTNKLIK